MTNLFQDYIYTKNQCNKKRFFTISMCIFLCFQQVKIEIYTQDLIYKNFQQTLN
jgi:hypothetical protein